MTPLKWSLLVIGAAVVITYTVWWYRSREEPVPGRGWAISFRAAALLLAWLILLNPIWPGAWQGGRRSAAVLLDASLSMSRPSSAAGPTIWKIAADSVRGAGAVWLFGGSVPRFVAGDSLQDAPTAAESRLVPALRAAALAGARRVKVYTDGALSDLRQATEEARRLGIGLSFVSLAPTYDALGIAHVRTSGWVQAGDTARVTVELVAAGGAGDSVRVEVVDEQNRIRASAWAAIPDPGRFSQQELALYIRGPAGQRRFRARLRREVVDPESRDDERVFYIRVTEQPIGPVLVSLRPDWEPSFLLASIDRVTDAPTTAYLWLADSLVNLDGYRSVSVSSVQRYARTAPLLVLHGFAADAPQWARSLAQDAERLLVFPAGELPFDLPGWDIRIQAPRGSEWYASEQVPQSRLALELAGYSAELLPPLLRVRSIVSARGWTPLTVKRMRRGEEVPALLAGGAGGRRWVVATAEGYWRWAFRPGSGRDLYRTLWTGMAGWLTEGRRSEQLGLEPLSRVASAGESLRWIAPSRADSLAIEIRSAEDSVVLRSTLAAADSLDARLPPGRYEFLSRAFRSGAVSAVASGSVDVEEFNPELLPGWEVTAPELALAAGADDRELRSAGERRLATLGWPYLILLALFAVEWIVRRRIGLR